MCFSRISRRKAMDLCPFFGMNGAVFLQFGKSALSLSEPVKSMIFTGWRPYINESE
jgi:hypothetical protein